MRILLIHTAGGEGSVALADTELGQAIVATEVLPGRTSSELLVPTVRRLLEARGWRLGELAAVVVVHGPGSFTGVRVGLSAAKGLSEAGGVPLIAVSRLALLAARVDGGGGPVHAVLDAGAGRVLLRGSMWDGIVCERPCCLARMCSPRLLVGLWWCVRARWRRLWLGSSHGWWSEPSAADALPFALQRIEARDFDDAATLDANYLRQSDAEIFAKPSGERAAR